MQSAGAEGRLGAHVPAAWPLSVRYNGSVDSSEEWGLIVASRLASRVPRARNAVVAVGELQWWQYRGFLDWRLVRTLCNYTSDKTRFCYLGR